MRELQVSKQNLRQVRIADVVPNALVDGTARLRLNLFALTSNNLTYAAMGDSTAGYWDFFPGPIGWGKPPAWGLGTVIDSRAPSVTEGARYYGFFPVSETLDVTPFKAGARGFIDGAPQRTGKAVVYNHYADTHADTAYDSSFELEQPLIRPLYPSGWWLAERVQQGHPARVLISSASSKTALSAAAQLRRRGGAELVALTSARHQAFVARTGLYDHVHNYDDLTGVSLRAHTTYVDFLGREELTEAVHRRLGASLEQHPDGCDRLGRQAGWTSATYEGSSWPAPGVAVRAGLRRPAPAVRPRAWGHADARSA